MIAIDEHPAYENVLREVESTERGDGWLLHCEQRSDYLAMNQQFVDALAYEMRQMALGAVLEVCAGNGKLSAALSACGICIRAVDMAAPPDTDVLKMDAADALRRFEPRIVLGSFVPFDSGVDEAVMNCPSVHTYIVLNAHFAVNDGLPGAEQTGRWRIKSLDHVRRWMITRHDVWLASEQRIVPHGEAWLLEKCSYE